MADSSMPRILGRYALHDRLAAGGMASVHLGRLLGPVGFARTVAIKRLHPEFAGDPEFVAMFLDEARLVARISHPNVVPTLDVVATEGELFIVMEYIRGEALAGLVRAARKQGTRITPAMTATIMASALHGLHAAHEAKNERGEALGIVHRDVSPQNILVGVDGVPRVLDFGVAKAAGRVHTTRDGQIKGKLAYMSPEQVRGSVSRATDIYAAGVVLWELLAGRPLFAAENEATTLLRVMDGCTEPPSNYAADVPPSLDAVALKALQINPADRYATAREMARALEEAIPLVPTSMVGEWVEKLVHSLLSVRGQRIAEIESDVRFSSLPMNSEFAERSSLPPSFPSPSMPPPAVDGAYMSTGASLTERLDVAPPQLGGSTMPLYSQPKTGAKGNIVIMALAAFGLVALGGIAATWLRPEPIESGPQSVVISPSVAPLAESAPLMVAPSPSNAPIAATIHSAPILTPEPIVTPVVTSTKPQSTGARRPPPPSTKNCDPPYFYDSRGLKVFKKECL